MKQRCEKNRFRKMHFINFITKVNNRKSKVFILQKYK